MGTRRITVEIDEADIDEMATSDSGRPTELVVEEIGYANGMARVGRWILTVVADDKGEW